MTKKFYKKKNQQTWFFYHYFFLLFGFFGGNLWGSFFSSFYLPPFFFVIGILLCLEILSYIYYKKISLLCSGLPFDAFALPEKHLSIATPRAGARRCAMPIGQRRATLLDVLLGPFLAQQQRGAPKRAPSPCPTVTASKAIHSENAQHIEQVDENTLKLKNFSLSHGFLPFKKTTDFSFKKTKCFSKKKMEFTNNLNESLNLIQNRNKSLYLLKVGLVFGLFVDAFKVGS